MRRDGGVVGRWMVLALCAALGACEAAQAGDVEPLPPLERPSAEKRAGLPEVAGTWRFTGFEIPPGDSTTVNADSTVFAPPGDFVVRLQRLDSLAGLYVRQGAQFPFVGEVRRDSVVSVIAQGPDGISQFAAGRVVRDTLWLELSSFSSAQTWPAGTRAALVRTPIRQRFRRFVGGAAIPVPVDSVALDSVRRADSLALVQRDSAAAAGGVPGVVVPGAVPAPGQPQPGAVVPGAVPPGAAPRPQAPVARPQAPVARPQVPVTRTPLPAAPPTAGQPAPRPPVQRPPVQRPPTQRPRRDTLRIPAAPPSEPVLPQPIPTPPRPAPRETIRIGQPPR